MSKEKKDLKKKRNIGKNSTLVQLYNNKKLVSKVDAMLDESQTYQYIVDFCKKEGLDISKATLTNYKNKREESIEKNIPLIQLLDKRVKDNVTYITKQKADTVQNPDIDESEDVPQKGGNGGGNGGNLSKEEKLFNDLEMLDEIIAKGRKGLKQFAVVDTPMAMKAIELKAKITNNQLSGLTIAGLREYKIRQRARETAIMEVIAEYIPEDKQEEVLDAIEAKEQEFYESMDLTEEGRRISDALEKASIDL